MILNEVSKHHSYWVLVASRLVGDYAEDIVQDMYVTLVDRNVKLDQRADLKTFIYRMLLNLCIDYLRKESRMKLCEIKKDMPQIEISEHDLAMDKMFEKVEKEMSNWDNYHRSLFEIYMFTGLSLRDLANGTDKEVKRIAINKYIKPEALRRGLNIHYGSIESRRRL